VSIETTPISGVSPTLQIMISLFERLHGGDLSSARRGSRRRRAVLLGYSSATRSPSRLTLRFRRSNAASVLAPQIFTYLLCRRQRAQGPIERPRRSRWTAAMSALGRHQGLLLQRRGEPRLRRGGPLNTGIVPSGAERRGSKSQFRARSLPLCEGASGAPLFGWRPERILRQARH
jgi:hypothetical protein